VGLAAAALAARLAQWELRERRTLAAAAARLAIAVSELRAGTADQVWFICLC
jgi:hypothetical protein